MTNDASAGRDTSVDDCTPLARLLLDGDLADELASKKEKEPARSRQPLSPHSMISIIGMPLTGSPLDEVDRDNARLRIGRPLPRLIAILGAGRRIDHLDLFARYQVVSLVSYNI